MSTLEDFVNGSRDPDSVIIVKLSDRIESLTIRVLQSEREICKLYACFALLTIFNVIYYLRSLN